MTGMTFGKGSIVTFTPDRFQVEYHRHDGDVIVLNGVGWGTVVVERDMWVATTEIMPMVIVAGKVKVADGMVGDKKYEVIVSA